MLEFSIILPCLNEEKTVGICIEKSSRALKQANASGEVIVVDNGSTDRSVQVAKKAGARVVFAEIQGYGSAIQKGIEEANGTHIIMGDADDTYDFLEIKNFIPLLRGGAEFVMGNRFGGKIHSNSMPFLHRWFGTPFLTWQLRLFFDSRISDVNCGLRGFKRTSMQKLNLKCRGMEFASEMIIKAELEKLNIKETPVSLFPDLPGRVPHLNSFRDGWRHYRVMLTLCPKYLFLYPGIVISLLSLLLIIVIHFSKIKIFEIPAGISVAAFSYALFFMGIQITFYGICAVIFNNHRNISKDDRITLFFKNHFTLEKGLLVGAGILGLGLILGALTIALIYNHATNLSSVNIPLSRLALLVIFIVLIGVQIIFSSFFLSQLKLDETLK